MTDAEIHALAMQLTTEATSPEDLERRLAQALEMVFNKGRQDAVKSMLVQSGPLFGDESANEN